MIDNIERERIDPDYKVEGLARYTYEHGYHTWQQRAALNHLTATYYIVKEIEEIEL